MQFGGIAVDSFGKRLRSLRKKKGHTLRSLSKQCDVSHTYLSDLENDRRGAPTAPVLERLADGLDVTVDELLGREARTETSEDTITSLNRGDLPDDLPPEAIKEIEAFKRFVLHKYGKDKKTDS